MTTTAKKDKRIPKVGDEVVITYSRGDKRITVIDTVKRTSSPAKLIVAAKDVTGTFRWDISSESGSRAYGQFHSDHVGFATDADRAAIRRRALWAKVARLADELSAVARVACRDDDARPVPDVARLLTQAIADLNDSAPNDTVPRGEGARSSCFRCNGLWGACTCEDRAANADVGFEFGGMWIVDPSLSECGRFLVEPSTYYGQPYLDLLTTLTDPADRAWWGGPTPPQH